MRAMISAGRIPRRSAAGPALVEAADVDRVRAQRRDEAARRHPDTVSFAREVRRVLHPLADLADDTVELYDGRVQPRHTVPVQFSGVVSGPKALPFLSPDAAALFGPDVLQAAAAPAKSFAYACRWCFADMSARVHESIRPENSAAHRVLLGEPCARDRERFTAEATAARSASQALKARLDRQAAAQRKADARTAFTAARAAAQTAQQRFEAASQALIAADPSAASLAASGRPARPGLPCGCTRDVYCGGHASQFGTYDRTQARRV